MAKPDWKDGSHYSQSDKERVPNVWVLSRPELRIVVHRWHGLDPKLWFMTCHELRIAVRELGKISVEEAQEKALQIAEATLEDLVRAFRKMKGGV